LETKSHDNYKWLVLSVTTIGALMASIDSNIVILALPDMMASLHADLVQMTWVIMSYILVSTVILLAIGRVADMLGRVKLYNLGFIIFTVGSILCGISQNAVQLILARMLQGAGGALMIVNSAALITEVFPPDERGRALGINGITFSFGGILGPVLGGLILSSANWRWIFFINVPIGIAGTIWAFITLRETRPKATGERFDWIGASSFSVGLLCLLGALTLGISAGFGSPFILALFALFAAMVVLFVARERRCENPVLDFSLFKSRVYTFSSFAAMMQSLAMFALNFLVVFYFQAVRGYDPLKAALMLLPMPIVTAFVAPFSGMLADKIGARIPATTGVLIQCAALGGFIAIRPDTPYLPIAIGLALTGLGGGLFYSPNTSAAMNAAPRNRLGIASAALATLRQTGMVTSFALAMAVAAASLPREDMLKLFVGTKVEMGSSSMAAFVVGMRAAFSVSLVLLFVAAFFSAVRGKEDRAARAECEEQASNQEC
jgi:EmrB/QacA subfamily drug resistance transporter